MIAVIGSFRFPPDMVAQVRPLMRSVIEATLAEPGCRDYAYAEDVIEPGLFRVIELWDSRDALAAHFTTSHMKQWSREREGLGFFDRRIACHALGPGEDL